MKFILITMAILLSSSAMAQDSPANDKGSLVADSGCITLGGSDMNPDNMSLCTIAYQRAAEATIEIGNNSFTIDSSKSYPNVDSNALYSAILAMANNGFSADQAANLLGPVHLLFKRYIANSNDSVAQLLQPEFLKVILKTNSAQ